MGMFFPDVVWPPRIIFHTDPVYAGILEKTVIPELNKNSITEYMGAFQIMKVKHFLVFLQI